MKKSTRLLALTIAAMMGMSTLASAESLNLADLPLTEEEGASVIILGMNSWYSTVDLTDAREHHEIYLSDPRRTQPDRLKTVIRLPVRRMQS